MMAKNSAFKRKRTRCALLIIGISSTLMVAHSLMENNLLVSIGVTEKDKDNKFSENHSLSLKPLVYGTGTILTSVPSDLLPRGITEGDDRIEKQLASNLPVPKAKVSVKRIVQMSDFHYGEDSEPFKNCRVKECLVSSDKNLLTKAGHMVDAVWFGQSDGYWMPPKLPHQVWMLFVLESPRNTYNFNVFRDKINWTLTYRRDSTIVTPYFKFSLHEGADSDNSSRSVNYAHGKTKLAAWFVSNCHSASGRLSYVRELQKYINVDIYGACGNKICSKDGALECDEMLARDYKFYLAFENSLCKDYVSEKPLEHGLKHNVVPVVMGASFYDYTAVLPPKSFIFADENPKDLADRLLMLDKNDSLYNEYFTWKTKGSFIETGLMCRICAMLHTPLPPIWHEDVASWWNMGACRYSKFVDHI